MAYTPTAWVNDSAPDLEADNLNKLEAGVQAAAATADAAKTKADAAATSAALTSGLAGKADKAHTHTSADLSDATTIGKAVLTATDGVAARNAIGAQSIASGTVDELNAGTGTTARIWTPKILKDFIDARIDALAAPKTG